MQNRILLTNLFLILFGSSAALAWECNIFAKSFTPFATFTIPAHAGKKTNPMEIFKSAELGLQIVAHNDFSSRYQTQEFVDVPVTVLSMGEFGEFAFDSSVKRLHFHAKSREERLMVRCKAPGDIAALTEKEIERFKKESESLLCHYKNIDRSTSEVQAPVAIDTGMLMHNQVYGAYVDTYYSPKGSVGDGLSEIDVEVSDPTYTKEVATFSMAPFTRFYRYQTHLAESSELGFPEAKILASCGQLNTKNPYRMETSEEFVRDHVGGQIELSIDTSRKAKTFQAMLFVTYDEEVEDFESLQARLPNGELFAPKYRYMKKNKKEHLHIFMVDIPDGAMNVEGSPSIKIEGKFRKARVELKSIANLLEENSGD